jgi:hypothetical protein
MFLLGDQSLGLGSEAACTFDGCLWRFWYVFPVVWVSFALSVALRVVALCGVFLPMAAWGSSPGGRIFLFLSIWNFFQEVVGSLHILMAQ